MNRVDQEAFLSLTSIAGPACLRHAYLLTGNQEDAEDVWQEACLRALKSWPRVRAANEPAAYLMRIVINTFLTLQRQDNMPTVLDPDSGSLDVGVAPPVDDSVVNQLGLKALLAELTPQQRAAVVLRYYGDLPYEQIASIMDVEASSARSLVTRGLSAMRHNLPPRQSTARGANNESI